MNGSQTVQERQSTRSYVKKQSTSTNHPYYSTTSLPFIFLCPRPQYCEWVRRLASSHMISRSPSVKVARVGGRSGANSECRYRSCAGRWPGRQELLSTLSWPGRDEEARREDGHRPRVAATFASLRRIPEQYQLASREAKLARSPPPEAVEPVNFCRRSPDAGNQAECRPGQKPPAHLAMDTYRTSPKRRKPAGAKRQPVGGCRLPWSGRQWRVVS